MGSSEVPVGSMGLTRNAWRHAEPVQEVAYGPDEFLRIDLSLVPRSVRDSVDRLAVLLQLGELRVRTHHGCGDQEEGDPRADAAGVVLVPLGCGVHLDHRCPA